eukprot:5905802-Pyramimonas_sp.AAC.1
MDGQRLERSGGDSTKLGMGIDPNYFAPEALASSSALILTTSAAIRCSNAGAEGESENARGTEVTHTS